MADNRWHEPTYHEMVRFARALHEVVERLVQALETLGQTSAAAEMPLLPGKTMADYLRTLVWWSAHDDKVARFLPVIRRDPPRLGCQRHVVDVGNPSSGWPSMVNCPG